MASDDRKVLTVDFEVHGNVQGVFFRKYTQKQAEKYGLVGWVKNTPEGTVIGTVQGTDSRVAKMKTWLGTEGSPKSTITKCDYRNERSIQKLEFTTFDIIRPKKKKRK